MFTAVADKQYQLCHKLKQIRNVMSVLTQARLESKLVPRWSLKNVCGTEKTS